MDASHSTEPESPHEPQGEKLPESIDLEQHSVTEASTTLLRLLQYSSSLREKTLHSAGGWVRESVKWRVPSAFRNSKSYSLYVRQIFDWVTGDWSNIRFTSTTSKEFPPQQAAIFLARKTLDNLLDMTALATFHISPLTVVAIYSELAFGATTFLYELSERLKEHGVIEQEAKIEQTADLIAALERASSRASRVFRKPPLSISGIHRTLEQLQVAAETDDPNQLFPFAEMEQLWKQMELAARAEQASIWDISATLAMTTIAELQPAGDRAEVSLEVQRDLTQVRLLDLYWQGLRDIERNGLVATLSRTNEPFLEQIWSNYSMDWRTWTDQLLRGELVKWGWSRISWPTRNRVADDHLHSTTNTDTPQGH